MQLKLTKKQRTNLCITLYDNGSALIEDRRQVDNEQSHINIDLHDLLPQTNLDTLFVKDAIVQEQKIISAMRDEMDLLKQFIGKEIGFRDNQNERYTAKVVKVEKDVILQLVETNQVLFNPIGQYYFPIDNLDCFTPKIQFQLVPLKKEITFYYRSGGLGWEMNYVLIVQGDVCRLKADIVLRNDSGIDFSNAQIQVIAGEIASTTTTSFSVYSEGSSEHPVNRAIETLQSGGHHLIVLPNQMKLANGEAVRVRYLDVSEIPIRRIYTFYQDNPKCLVTYHFTNNFECILPKGLVRIYEDQNQFAFVGEVNMKKMLPKEALQLNSSETTNLSISEELEVLHRTDDYCYYRKTYYVTNSTSNDELVHIIHKLKNDYLEIDFFNHDPVKIEGKDITFEMVVPKNSVEKLILEYSIEIN